MIDIIFSNNSIYFKKYYNCFLKKKLKVEILLQKKNIRKDYLLYLPRIFHYINMYYDKLNNV